MIIKATMGAGDAARLQLKLDKIMQTPARVKSVMRKHGARIQKEATLRSPEVETGPIELREHPWRTGHLRDSWGVTAEEEPNGYLVTIGNTADYAAYVELGTRMMDAQPMLEPAVDQDRDSYVADLTNALGEV